MLYDLLKVLKISDPLLDIALRLEQAALHDPYFIERKLDPNVDFYSGIIMEPLGSLWEIYGNLCYRPHARLDRKLSRGQ